VISSPRVRDTFVTGRSYILAMKTMAITIAVLFASASGPLAFGQTMMQGSGGSSSGGTGTMMEANTGSGGTGTMMQANTGSADANGMMQAAPGSGGASTTMMSSKPMADPKVGAELRAAPGTGRKIIYSTLAAAEALAAKAPTVLFFAADWCPYCQADLKDINAHGERLGDIAIVVVDYDKERQLEKMYGVTVQDTFVQIDSMGAKLAAWNSGGVDGILARTKREG
jgi:thiol-disulfide isomerase/thioredoxin